MKCVQILLPALIENEDQQTMTDLCKKSIVSLEHCVKIDLDTKPYENKVAGVWNAFFDKWRGEEYDYLMITANDMQFDPLAIDYMVKCMEENPKAGIVSCHVTRDLEFFKKHFGQYEYTSNLTKGLKDPAAFVLRKGVIEKVGRVDEEFPCEFVERDLLYRCKLAGYEWIEPDLILAYHPPYSGTIGNPPERMYKALAKYEAKWGGDADKEQYLFPYNDMSLDYTYCKK